MEFTWSEILLIGLMTVCAATDAARRKIYNVVVFPSLLLALIGHLATSGWQGLGASFLGLSTGLALLLVPYLMGGMGAGDVKLLALVGALQGAEFALFAAAYMAMLGFILSVAFVLVQKKARSFLTYLLFTIMSWRIGRRFEVPRPDGALRTTMPYGLAIAGGALLALFWRGAFL